MREMNAGLWKKLRVVCEHIRSFQPMGYAGLVGLGVLCLGISPGSTCSFAASRAGPDELFERFQSPASEARPFVRWWWGENRVATNEIVRELDLLKRAGIGGVEILPIGLGARPREGFSTPEKPWLSPEWCKVVKFTCDEAARRDMRVDMSHAYGWPAKGSWLRPEHRASIIYSSQQVVTGPTLYETPLNRLRNWKNGKSVLKYARLVPMQLGSLDEVLNFDSAAAGDTLRIEVPKGKFVLQTGILVREFRGDMLDHYDRDAVQAYHDHITEKMAPYFDGNLGSGIRSFFADSIEVAGSNWTRFFEKEFFARRGYSIQPWVSFVLPPYRDRFVPSAEMGEQLRKVRFDFNNTLVELIHENFIGGFHDWCRDNHVKSRLQVYGFPWHFGIETGYLIPDIPEGNNWLTVDEEKILRGAAWNKFASSAGHAKGRRVISTEAMTTVSERFEIPLDWVKRADDFNFITGINHSVLHGFNYSPPEVQWPGIIEFGTFFGENNTWWPFLPKWTQYNARLSQVFQDTKPVVEIALLGPASDARGEAGLDREAFHGKAWYAYDHLWKAVCNRGANVDLLGEATLDLADVSRGRIAVGPMRYKLLVLCDVQTVHLKTMLHLRDFVSAGGQVAVVGAAPSAAAGRTDAADETVAEIMQQLMKTAPDRVKTFAAPADEKDLNALSGRLLNEFSLDRAIRIQQPDPRLFQIHQKTESGRDVVFFCNQDAGAAVQSDIQFNGLSGAVSLWNPETGTRTVVAPEGTATLALSLSAGESKLFVFEDAHASEVRAAFDPLPVTCSADRFFPVQTPWCVELHDVDGAVSEITLPELADFSEIPELDTFAGTAVYHAAVQLEPGWETISLGAINGVSELTVNGISAGSRWYGSHEYDIAGLLRNGSNDLEVKVTTLLFNRMRNYKNGAYLWHKDREAKRRQVVSAGMPGPVVLGKQGAARCTVPGGR